MRGQHADAGTRRRVALVTGASRGIGRATAEELAMQGADVLVVARDPAALDRAAVEIEGASGRRVEPFAADLSDPDQVLKVAHHLQEAFGVLDILVNNAGATRPGDLFAATEEDWTAGFALKFFGYVRLTRAVWPMLRQRNGTVLNVIGTAARTPSADFVIGGAVNAALANVTKATAESGLRDGVRVNAIHPGAVRTRRLAEIGMTGERPVATVEDCARVIAFLVSPAARHVVGEFVTVDGGATRSL